MEKKFILSLMLLFSGSQQLFSENKPEVKKGYLKLESKVIFYLDGVTNCLDGDAIEEILTVRKKIEEEKLGVLDLKTKIRKGKFLYNSKCYSSYELIKLDEQLKHQLLHEKDESKKKELHVRSNELSDCLKKAKNNFIDTTIGFMKRIEPVKSYVVTLIEESCRMRNIDRKDTIMLEWANTNCGSEHAIFDEKIKNFKEFDKFLNQVFNFLGDLLKSCPKGWDQFKKNKKLKA